MYNLYTVSNFIISHRTIKYMQAHDIGMNELLPYGCDEFFSNNNFINECYNNHLMLVPSQIDKKTQETEGGAPTVLIEAQSTGLPIIATDHADIPEIVIKDKSGFIVKEGDVEAMSQAINKVYSNSVLLEKMGRFGRNHVKKQHDMRKISYQLEDLYKLAIKRNK